MQRFMVWRVSSLRRFSTAGGGGSIRLGKNKVKQPAATTNANPPPVVQPEAPPPQYYYQQQPPPPSFGQSIVIYALFGFAFAFGITLVRMVFAESKLEDDVVPSSHKERDEDE